MEASHKEALLRAPGIRRKHDVALAYGREHGPSIAGEVEALFWQTVDAGPQWRKAERPILKVLRAEEWAALCALKVTNGAPIDQKDGYIHFSTPEQVDETVARHFAGETGLWLLTYDAASLGPELIFEPSRGGLLFPHLYGPLRLSEACLIRPWA